MKAVEELGYVPNQAARTLVTRRTGTVALVIAESEERIFGEPFFAGVVRGISSALNEASRQLVLSLVQSNDQATAPRQPTSRRQHVDGVLLLSLHDDEAFPVDLDARRLPVVLGGRSAALGHGVVRRRGQRRRRAPGGGAPDRDRPPYDRHDHRSRGPWPPVVIVSTVMSPRSRDAGIAYDDDLVVEGRLQRAERARRAWRQLLARRPDIDGGVRGQRPDGDGCDACPAGPRSSGVPRTSGSSGFDGTKASETTEPPLSTVRQPLVGSGRGWRRCWCVTSRRPIRRWRPRSCRST